MTTELSRQILEGGYWLVEPAADAEIALVVSGPLVAEVMSAREALSDDLPGLGVLVITSPDRLQRGWINARRSAITASSHVNDLLAKVPATAGLVTLLDGHSGALSWLGAVQSHRVVPLGVERFGQSGSIPELYGLYGLDEQAIIAAVARLCIEGIVSKGSWSR